MTQMWSRRARERRITGLTYLTHAAIALAVAVLLFTHGGVIETTMAALMGLGAIALTILAIHEFTWAHKYANLAR